MVQWRSGGAFRFCNKSLGLSRVEARFSLTSYNGVNTIIDPSHIPVAYFIIGRKTPPQNLRTLGISLAVGRLTLNQVAEVRILDPQPVF